MIASKLKKCCYECNYPDLNIDIDHYDAICVKGKELIEECTNCTIYCAHAKVCKIYLESEEE